MKNPILSILREHRQPMRVHLIGVAGSGMSGLASLFLDLGHQVSGSDKVSTTETARLVKNGLVFSSPHGERAVEECEMVVYSSAIKPGNPCYDAAEKLGIPLVRRAEALSAIMHNRKGVIVAGTHGKTTTSALSAHVLRVGGLKPSHYVGAEIPILGVNAHWDKEGDYFVAEGDESDGTLAGFHAEHAIILNVEAEHLDFYNGLDDILAVFQRLLEQTRGFAIFCGECPNATALAERRVIERGRDSAVLYGWNHAFDVSAEILEMEPHQSRFRLFLEGKEAGDFTLGIPGQHNVLNALAVIALATRTGIALENLAIALSGFRGAKRRFDVKLRTPHFTVVDDYGHHPSEIAVTLQTARSLNPQRLVVLFQPHRYSRTQLLKEEFGRAFPQADAVFITDVYAASERPLPGVSGLTLVEEVRKTAHPKCEFVPDKATAQHVVGNFLRPGDVLITLGAGDIHEVGTRLARDLKLVGELLDLVEPNEAQIKLYEPMSRHTTILIGGPAQYWIEPMTEAALQKIVRYLRTQAVPLRVVGRGSNLLVQDGGIAGAVIHLGKGVFTEVRAEGNHIVAGAGARLKKVASVAQAAGLTGFEWMEGIPGQVGGGLRMNAGAMGVQTFDQVVSVRMLDASGEIIEKQRADIHAEYRHVAELEDHFALSAVFTGSPAPAAVITAKMGESQAKRRASQPIAASAGCIFKNHELTPAGKLVDDLGLKGSNIGPAEISPVHGNFMVNNGGAKAADLLTLIGKVKETAMSERGLSLETEVQIIGQQAPVV